MKKTRFLASIIGNVFTACLLATSLKAQDDPKPKEPLLPRAPDMAAWTITYRYKATGTNLKPSPSPGAKPVDQITSIQIQKTGKIYHRVVNWSSGAQTDTWNINQKQVTKDRMASTYALLPSEGPATDDYSKSDFEDLAWINQNYYAGYKKAEQPVFVFQSKNVDRPMTRREKFNPALTRLLQPTPAESKTRAESGGATPPKPDAKSALQEYYGDSVATVVLDANTQLPVAYDDGRTILVYQFTPAPQSLLTPPPEVTKILRRFDDYAKGTTVHPSTP